MSSSDKPERQDDSFLPEIRRARFERLTIYEMSESELVILERGSPDSIYLNFAIFLLSVAVALTVALLTTSTSPAVFTIFVVCTVVGYVGGVFLLILWRRNRSSVSECIETVRKRLPPEGIGTPP